MAEPCGCEESQALRLALYRALAELVGFYADTRTDDEAVRARMDAIWYALTPAQRAELTPPERG